MTGPKPATKSPLIERVGDDVASRSPQRTRTQRLYADARKNHRLMIAGAIVLCMALVGVAAPLVSPHNPETINPSLSFAGPSAEYWLGNDQYGRDVLSRIIYGARISIQVAIYSVALALVTGAAVGVIASYYGSWIDTLFMRSIDILYAFPPFILALTIATYLGPSLRNIVLVIAILYMPIFARLVYAVTRTVRDTEYVEAARAIGASDRRIILRAILPNSMAAVIVQTSLSLGYAILTESGLSFLGVGVPPPAPSWGTEIASARLTLTQAPMLVLWPSLAVSIAILSFNILGDALRDVLDPRLRGR